MKRAMLIALLAVLFTSQLLLAKAKVVEGVVNLNTATLQELMLLPGVGKTKAEAILSYRQSHPFKATSELTEVKGIGPKMVQQLEKFVTIQGLTTIHEVEKTPRPATTQ